MMLQRSIVPGIRFAAAAATAVLDRVTRVFCSAVTWVVGQYLVPGT